MGLFDFLKKKKDEELDDQIEQAQKNLAEMQEKAASGEQLPPLTGQNDMAALKNSLGIMGITQITVDTSKESLDALIAATGDLSKSNIKITHQDSQPKQEPIVYGTIIVDGEVLTKCAAEDRSPMLMLGHMPFSSDWGTYVAYASLSIEEYGEDVFADNISEFMPEILGEVKYVDSETWVYGLDTDGSAILYCREENRYMHFYWDMIAKIIYSEDFFQL